MNPGIKPGLVPPELGQEKEEPELSTEDDIPSDDGGERPADEPIGESRPPREPPAASEVLRIENTAGPARPQRNGLSASWAGTWARRPRPRQTMRPARPISCATRLMPSTQKGLAV
jgi:hypothetical protein